MGFLSVHDPRLPLYHRLKEELVQRIRNRDWDAGEMIPTESELANRFSVSIGTVRKAVDILVAEGLLERFQGRGTFVRRKYCDPALFRFFRLENKQGEQLIPESQILDFCSEPVNPEVAGMLALPDQTPVLFLRRLRLLEGEPILLESIWLPESRFFKLRDLSPSRFSDLLYPMYEEHCEQLVASVRETISITTLIPEEAEWLKLDSSAVAILIERIAFNHLEEPIEWRRSVGKTDKFQYRIHIK